MGALYTGLVGICLAERGMHTVTSTPNALLMPYSSLNAMIYHRCDPAGLLRALQTR